MILCARRTGRQQMLIPHSVLEQSGANKIDNHADTVCTDANWKLLDVGLSDIGTGYCATVG